MKDIEFTKHVEALVDPIQVGSIHFLQQFLNKLPKKQQNKIIEGASKDSPFMGFVVEPYSSFLCFEVLDVAWANSLLSDNFEMVPSRVIKDEEPKYYALFGSFNVHTSAFWGSRMEFYLVAKDKNTGILSWIIVDYDTNTISYDKKGGLIGPSTRKSVITTDYSGKVIVDVVRKDNSRVLDYVADLEHGKLMDMDPELWLFGNLSIGYSKDLSNNSPDVFSLKFHPDEVAKAYRIEDEGIHIHNNTWYTEYLGTNPEHVLVFPYAQHMVSDSPGNASNYRTVEEMLVDKEKLDFSKVKVYDSTQSTRLMMRSTSLMLFIMLVLVLIIIFK